MKYEVIKNQNVPDTWNVEAVNDADGTIYVVVFYGPNAQERAEEYAGWKNKL